MPPADTLQAMCFDRTNGRLLWSRDVAKGIRQDAQSNYANPSPVTDGKLVIFFYGNGDLVCFDVAGERRWARNIQQDYGPFAFFWTFGGSPLLFDGKLYLQVLQRNVAVAGRGLKDRENESYLLALDPDTGRTLWRQVRRSQAADESQESHTTPIPVLYAGQKQLLIAGGDALSGHDAATGKELWRWGDWNPSRAGNWPLIASPVAGDGVALVCVPKGQPVYAVKLGGSGALDDHAVAWTSRGDQASNVRSADARLLRWRFLRAQRLAELPVARRFAHGQSEMGSSQAGVGQVRSLAAGRGRKDLPDQLRGASRRRQRDQWRSAPRGRHGRARR